MTTLGTLTLADLAGLFRRSVPRTSAHVRMLAEQHGFPPALPGAKPKLWSRLQVEAWLRDPQRAALAPLAPANDAGDDPAFSSENIAAARARLAQRYGARNV